MNNISPVFMYWIGDHKHDNYGKFVVMTVKDWGYVEYNSKWMEDKTIGDSCLVPDLDIVDEKFWFDREQEALNKVAELYAKQLKGE